MNSILLIDDDASVRAAMRQVLESAGHQVHEAVDGLQGAAALQAQGFDLVILDLDLPKMNGFDVLDLARGVQPLVPVLIVTGMATQCEPGAVAGADALLEKPPEVPVLLDTVAKLLAEGPQQSAQKGRWAAATSGVLTQLRCPPLRC